MPQLPTLPAAHASLTPRTSVPRRPRAQAAYGYVTAAERVATAARRALEELRCPSCRVFLMSNCRNQSAWEYLHDEIPTLSLYAPSSERFAGARSLTHAHARARESESD
eukprot:803877-Pleurochrysis_carterae.AAC.3